jgi:hypothetical protein
MPRPSPLSPEDYLDEPAEPFSTGARVGWWGGYVVLVLVAFCFGVWAGTQRSRPAETVAAPTPTPAEKPEAKHPEPVPEPKKELAPEPKKTPEVKLPEPKKGPEVVTPEPMITPEPKKTPEVKKTPAPKTAPAVPDVSFVTVQPIFKAKCTFCHGDSKSPKGDLDMRSLAKILKGGDNGPGVKPKDLAGSLVWATIDDGTMPPPDSGKGPVTEAEKTLIRNWILSGAK